MTPFRIFQWLVLSSVALLCGCATANYTTLDHYRWSPEAFQITFPSGHWKYAHSLTSNGEHHEFYHCRSLFTLGDAGQVNVASYLPTRSGTHPASPEEVLSNVTNFLSKTYLLSVTVIEKSEKVIIWEWSGITKVNRGAQSGIEKIVRGERGTYRLSYVCGLESLTPHQRRTWLPIIQNAKLTRRAD